MRRLALAALTVAALSLPASAQPAPPQPAEGTEEGLGLIERGIGMLFRNLMSEAAPQLDLMTRDLSGALQQLAPALQDLAVLVDDIRHYHPPERLENGDVLIRRRAEAPPPPPIGDGLRGLVTPGDPAPDLTPTPSPDDIEI
ncbi:MAG: hypothetical protein ACK41U_09405 [Paracoccus sp. (in: a-proteobacteria)]|uniref:hypothetical protein n=1 Tax=Paracoccus sp. TaxID=267 RepID=UPI00391ABC4B